MYCKLHPGERECPYCGRIYDAADGAEDCGCMARIARYAAYEAWADAREQGED